MASSALARASVEGDAKPAAKEPLLELPTDCTSNCEDCGNEDETPEVEGYDDEAPEVKGVALVDDAGLPTNPSIGGGRHEDSC